MYLHIHGFYTGSLKVRLLVSDFGGPMRCVQARGMRYSCLPSSEQVVGESFGEPEKFSWCNG